MGLSALPPAPPTAANPFTLSSTSTSTPAPASATYPPPSNPPQNSKDRTIRLPPSATILPFSEPHLDAFRRLLTTLIPIRYPKSFYAKLLSNPDGLWISKVAFWDSRKSEMTPQGSGSAQMVGLVCARLEPAGDLEGAGRNDYKLGANTVEDNTAGEDTTGTSSPPGTDLYDIYISQIAVLAPYRSQSLGTALLEASVSEAEVVLGRLATCNPKGKRIRRVYAHAREVDEDVLQWYRGRGFEMGEVVPSYYSRLRPSGARVVWRAAGG
ncbi:MAG: hypothetical protein MMC23_004459 [Stictis urceolatum]|nr:hypothetical protein [Stictis urceolata]